MKPEILAPAGNFEKMKAAIHFGADAVYLAGQVFGMRAAADNFTNEELIDAVNYAHAHNVRIYITVNTMPREYEYERLKEYLLFLGTTGADALIVADIGVLTLAHTLLPQMELHISTQACTVSSEACLAWHALGAKRIVLSRELTLEEIKAIRTRLPEEIELECFVHGSMCISYSGRCLLSNFLTGRDANHGACAQPCRWNYSARVLEITEERHEEAPLDVMEEQGETFIMASRDLCMIEHMEDLLDAGITSLKIEGRMKSAYYTGCVSNVYKMARDASLNGKPYNPLWLKELESVTHREYDTGYFYTDCHMDAKTCHSNGYMKEKSYFATIESYDPNTGLALCRQKNKMKLGDPIELLTPGFTGRSFVVKTLYDEDQNPIESTPHAAMGFYIKLPYDAMAGDMLRSGS